MKCETCGHHVHPTCDLCLPIAERTAVNYLGRNIYIIHGMPGLYWLRGDCDTEMVSVVRARRPTARGKCWFGSDFIRKAEIEQKLFLAIPSPRITSP